MERNRTIVWGDPKANNRETVSSLSGLEYLKKMMAGQISPAPAAGLVGYKIVEVENGRSVFELDIEEYHYNAFSTVHGGIITTLLDSAMTSSVLSTLPAGVSCTTVEFKVNFIKPATMDTSPLICEAMPVHVGKRLATVQGRITDRQGQLYAHGTGTCSIFSIKLKDRQQK